MFPEADIVRDRSYCEAWRCGRSAVAQGQYNGAFGQEFLCEGHRPPAGERYRDRFSDIWRPGEGAADCECACGHVFAGPPSEMDRAASHLRCPDCVAAGHPAVHRSEREFWADPRFHHRADPTWTRQPIGLVGRAVERALWRLTGERPDRPCEACGRHHALPPVDPQDRMPPGE